MKDVTRERIAERRDQFRSAFHENGEVIETSTLRHDSHPFDGRLERETFKHSYFRGSGETTRSFFIPQRRTDQKWGFNAVFIVYSGRTFSEILTIQKKMKTKDVKY